MGGSDTSSRTRLHKMRTSFLRSPSVTIVRTMNATNRPGEMFKGVLVLFRRSLGLHGMSFALSRIENLTINPLVVFRSGIERHRFKYIHFLLTLRLQRRRTLKQVSGNSNVAFMGRAG